MKKYHISPDTGRPNICVAAAGKCKFKLTDHFDTKEAAREFYEASQSGYLSGSKKKFRKAEGQVSHLISEVFKSKAIEALEKANRKLEKAGIPERFTWTVEEVMTPTEERLKTGHVFLTPQVRIVVDSPAIGHEGYTFLAAIEKAESGFVVKEAKGAQVDAPESLKCDQCGRNVERLKTYVVQDTTGKRLQLGSECVKTYLGGIKPEGLWALGFDPIAGIDEADEEYRQRNVNPASLARPTELMVAYGLAVSNGGEDFVSKSQSEWLDKPSTSSKVEQALFGADNEWSTEMQNEAEAYVKSGEAKRVLKKLHDEADTTSSFGKNLAVITSGEAVRSSHMNILIGGLSKIAREKADERKKKAEAEWGEPTEGFADFKGASLKNRVFKVKENKEIDGEDYNGRPITKSRVTLRDEDNHEVVWWASKVIEAEKGEILNISSGRVKDHKTYKDVDQTVVTGLRFKKD